MAWKQKRRNVFKFKWNLKGECEHLTEIYILTVTTTLLQSSNPAATKSKYWYA